MENKPILKERLAHVLETKRKEAGGKKKPNFVTVSNYLGYSEVKNLQRQLKLGYIKSDYLEKISEFLNVSPDYLSGKVDLLDNGEIPTYSTYLFWNKFDNWSKKHTLYDLTIVLLKYQGGDPANYSEQQIVNLSLGICRIVNEFIKNMTAETPIKRNNTNKKAVSDLGSLFSQKEGK